MAHVQPNRAETGIDTVHYKNRGDGDENNEKRVFEQILVGLLLILRLLNRDLVLHIVLSAWRR